MYLFISLSNSTSDPIKNVIQVVIFDSEIGHLSSTSEHFLKNTMFLKTCSFWKSCKNVIQVVDFRSRNNGNSCISERMLKNVIQVVDSEHRKVHFLKSDFSRWRSGGVHKVFWNLALSFLKRALSFLKSAHLTWEFMMFSKMVLWLGLFYVLELSKQWKFIAFWARRLEIRQRNQ